MSAANLENAVRQNKGQPDVVASFSWDSHGAALDPHLAVAPHLDAVRLAAQSDDAIETYLVRPAGDVEWSMTVLVRRRRIRTDISRTNLCRGTSPTGSRRHTR